MNKMVINHLEKLFVTNDAATIIRELEVCPDGVHRTSASERVFPLLSPRALLWATGSTPGSKDVGHGNGDARPGSES